LYYTDASAKAAAVSDSITDGVTDVAPSQDAVYDALATKLENISEDTTKIMLQFHKKPRRSMYFGHYKKVILYDADDDKTYTRTDHDDRWSVSHGDKVSIYVPRLSETIYRAPFGYMLKRRVIRLNEASYPLYKLSLNLVGNNSPTLGSIQIALGNNLS
jgi:hypothetical protein